jgi:hypothetical protein
VSSKPQAKLRVVEQTFDVSLFNCANDNEPKPQSLTWGAFVELCRKPTVRRAKDGALFSAALLKGTRKNENVQHLSMLALDYDHDADFDTDLRIWRELRLIFFAYTSHSHLRKTDKNPRAEQRFRVVLPLAVPILPTDYLLLWKWAAEQSDNKIDAAPKALAQMFYLPAKASANAPYRFEEHSGSLLDWRTLELKEESQSAKAKQPTSSVKSSEHLSLEDARKAVLPREKFVALCKANPLLKTTFLRKRSAKPTDLAYLKDRSPSGYIYSLENFAAHAGWSAQEAFSLVRAWRSEHNETEPLEETLRKFNRESEWKKVTSDAAKARTTSTKHKKREPTNQQKTEGLVETQENDSKPEIDASDKDFPTVTRLAWDALLKANEPPRLFRHRGIACRVEEDDERAPVVFSLDEKLMTNELTEAAYWYVKNRKGEMRDATPTVRLVNNVRSVPDIKLPILSRIVTAPVFAADGTLQTTAGYHPQSRTYYHEVDGFRLEPVPERPTQGDIDHARATIVDVMIGQFPFTSEAERAHAVALLLLPFARDLIKGATPLHIIEAPTGGSGKTLLADVLAYASTLSPSMMTEGRDEDEWRKRLTAMLRSDPSYLIIDNVRGRLESAQLSSLLTTNIWQDRILGESTVMKFRVHCAFVATANNPAFSSEMMRRSVRVRLDPKCDEPWLRSGFEIEDLRAWATDNRAELVWSALVMIRAWLAKGRPLFTSQKLGSYERWSKVIGGILDVSSVSGFLENLEEFYREADTDGEAWRVFAEQWWYLHGSEETTVSNLWHLSQRIEMFEVGHGTEHSQKIIFGQMIAKARDRQIGNFRIVRAGTLRRATLWRLEYVGSDTPPLTNYQEREREKLKKLENANSV